MRREVQFPAMENVPFVEISPPKAERRPLKRRLNEQPKERDTKTQRSTETQSQLGSAFEDAKRLFHRAARVRIVGRTAERAVIQRFWSSLESKDEAKVLYICGNPGTGKTALVEEMLPVSVQIVKVNCMMQSDPRETLSVIAHEIGMDSRMTRRWDDLAENLSSHFCRIKKTVVLVLDEIDQIAMRDAPLLEAIFEWPYLEKSKVVILGIANALDLSIRYFSAPPSRVNILNFSPYTPEDISRILIARLELTPTLIVPVAVEMCARKVSAVGDLRKALEIMRESVTLAETSGAERVELAHVTQAMERIFGSTVRTTSRNAQLVSELNLHQKLLLVTLYRLLKDSVTLKPTVQSLFERYTSTVRTHRIIDAVGRSEFNDLVANTESMGVISLVAAGKRARNSGPATPDTKVLLSLPLEDVKQGLSDNTILRQMLIL